KELLSGSFDPDEASLVRCPLSVVEMTENGDSAFGDDLSVDGRPLSVEGMSDCDSTLWPENRAPDGAETRAAALRTEANSDWSVVRCPLSVATEEEEGEPGPVQS